MRIVCLLLIMLLLSCCGGNSPNTNKSSRNYINSLVFDDGILEKKIAGYLDRYNNVKYHGQLSDRYSTERIRTIIYECSITFNNISKDVIITGLIEFIRIIIRQSIGLEPNIKTMLSKTNLTIIEYSDNQLRNGQVFIIYNIYNMEIDICIIWSEYN